MNKQTIRDIEVHGKRVLVRVDFNVPLDKVTGEITDDRRISASLPTIKYLTENEARVVLCSHLGRPKGITPGLSMAPIAKRLSELLRQPVKTTTDCIGTEVSPRRRILKAGLTWVPRVWPI